MIFIVSTLTLQTLLKDQLSVVRQGIAAKKGRKKKMWALKFSVL